MQIEVKVHFVLENAENYFFINNNRWRIILEETKYSTKASKLSSSLRI